MQTLFASCPYDQLSLDQLSDSQLLAKRAKNRQLGGYGLLLLILIVGMAFVLESYLVGVASWALIPAMDEYNKKRKAIIRQLQKRCIG